MSKIALLSAASSIHTIRWANGLADAGHEIHVVTQQTAFESFDRRVKIHHFPFTGVGGYFLMVPFVRRLFQRLSPDVVNAHYASGYGTTARLVNYHPWVLSVWGSDVYDFPYKSPLHRYLVKKNLLAADLVASTSNCMAAQTKRIAPALTNIAITPFGVDMECYSSINFPDSASAESVVIGTVKAMESKYGVTTLLRAFALLRKKMLVENPGIGSQLQLRLVGDGPQTGELVNLSNELGIGGCTVFVGRVPHAQVPNELAKLDIFVALSELESFGVAIIEAGAAKRPVVVSDAGGLPEVTVDGSTGFVVPKSNPEAAAAAIEKLVLDAGLRRRMGGAGREHVALHYSWPACIKQMEAVYSRVLRSHPN